jgi:tripartite ATP-independent transporter DctM subunit
LKPGALSRRLEGGLFLAALAVATLLPLVEALGRPLRGLSVPGSAEWMRQATLFMAFLGALLAGRAAQHLTLSTAELLGTGRARQAARLLSNAVAAAVTAVLARASVDVVLAGRAEGKVLPGGIPDWILTAVMPVGLALLAARFAWGASDGAAGRLTAFAAVACGLGLGLVPSFALSMAIPLIVVILLAAILGAPVFVAMGGVALVLFFRDGTPVAAVPAEIYRLIGSPTLPAIPLLTAAGYILAEGRSSQRLVRFFRALFGGMPGGLAVMVTAVCALFTTFTGGSGVTIIALGGLVYPILREDGYPEGFSLGLVTAAGSLGLLFPPSLPVILYSVVAQVPADSLYVAGILPGLLLVGTTAAYGVWEGMRRKGDRADRPRFSAAEALRSGWAAKWELLLPVLVVVLFASGVASLVEAAAAACAYSVVVACFVQRDIPFGKPLAEVLLKAGSLMGAVLLLLSVAMGLTSWLVDAQVPARLLDAVRTNIHSPLVFLLLLNVFLLVLGSVLEIYSAIVILAPLVAPMGAAFGIDPVHLGVVFLANLELGFLCPPVGLNLLLASSRFGKPLGTLYAKVLPFFLIRAGGVLVITYVAALSMSLPKILGKLP